MQLHQNSLATLWKDLSLDDADTLAYHQNKIKKAQNDLFKSDLRFSFLFNEEKQDKLLVNVAAFMEMTEYLQDKMLAFMWYYLRKYKNNYAKNSSPPETCSNASTDARSGKADLHPQPS